MESKNGKTRFFTASDQDILDGRTTDVYFVRTVEVLKAKGMLHEEATAELTVARLPRDWKWSVFCGLEETLRLLEGKNVDLWGLPEGTIFPSRTQSGVLLPLLTMEGVYTEYCTYEAPMLGFLCHSTGVATMAARCRKAAQDRPVIAFGVRRSHPAISPMLDRSSYIGGCDGVSSLMGAELIGRAPEGTIPHALIVMMGDPVTAFKAFDEVVSQDVPRIALVDTYSDEKAEAVAAAEAIKDLFAVRLDTPSSRRGSFSQLVREVRWELDIRGFKHVRIILSGGLDETTIPPLVEAGADGFGVGTSVTNAPTVDFALDIIERNGRPVAKRGKFGGRKYVYSCPDCLNYEVTASLEEVPLCMSCGKEMLRADVKLLDKGRRVQKQSSVEEIRERAMKQLTKMGDLDAHT